MAAATASAARKRKLIKYLKRLFLSRKRKYQLKAIHKMKVIFDNRKCSPEYFANFLADGDLIVPMADLMSSLDADLLQYVSRCFLIIAKSKTFLEPTHASYIVQTGLRVFSLSNEKKQSLPAISCIIELVLMTLTRLIEQNAKLSYICDGSQHTLLELCQFTLKYFQKDPPTLMNCCFVVVAMFSEGMDLCDIENNEVQIMALKAAKTIKSMIFSRTITNKRSWFYLISRLGFFMLRSSRTGCDTSLDEQFSSLIYDTIVNSLIPFLLLIAQKKKEKSEEKVIHAVFTLLSEWLAQKKTVKNTKPLYGRIAASGIFYALSTFRFNYADNIQLRSLINAIILEVVILVSKKELCILPRTLHGQEEFRSCITHCFDVLPNKVSEWPDVLINFPAKTSIEKLLAILLFLCVHYYFTSSFIVPVQIFSGICHCLRAITTDFPKPVFKALWFIFAVMYLSCEEKPRIKKLPESLNAVIRFLDEHKTSFESMILHHQAILYWAFAAPNAPPSIQEKVVDSWLLKHNSKSITTLKNLCILSDKVSFCILNVLCSTEKPDSAKQAGRMFHQLLKEKPNYNAVLWKKSFLVFNSESISELNIFYLVPLLKHYPPLNMNSVEKLRIFTCLVSFWQKWETMESSGKKYYQILSGIIQLVQNFLSGGAPVPLVSITNAKFLKLVENNMQNSNSCVCFCTTRLFLSILKFLPSDLQLEQKVTLDISSVVKNISGNFTELSALSICLINVILKPENAKYVAFSSEISFSLLRELFSHLLLLMVKNSEEVVKEIWKCLSLVLNETKKLNSRKFLAHLVTHPLMPPTVIYFLDVTDNLAHLFTENFLNFLSNWFLCIHDDKLVQHLLICQRQNASHFVSNLYIAVLKTSEKLLQFLEDLELDVLFRPLLPNLENLVNVFLNFKYVIPQFTIDALKIKKDLLSRNKT